MLSDAAPRASALERTRDLIALTKPRLSSLVLITTAGGMWMAPGELSGLRSLLTLCAIMLVVGAANMLNAYLERDIDSKMERTHQRPLASQRLDPRFALYAGIAIALAALPTVALMSNTLTAWLALLAFLSYVCVYTPMKRNSPLALWVGAIPGALPPLMGWTASSGGISAGGMVLFAILYLWQLPHFLAIALYLRDDYQRGGLMVYSLTHSIRTTKFLIVGSISALIPFTYLPVNLGLATPSYGLVATALGLLFLISGILGFGARNITRWARFLFFGSIIYLSVLFGALVLAR